MFKKEFTIIRIFEDGLVITTRLKGRKREVMNDIKRYENFAKRKVIVGKESMILWV